MDIIGKRVMHKTFGEGICISVDEKILSVEFSDSKIKRFQYPISFDKYLTFIDEQLNCEIHEEINLYNQRLAQETKEKKLHAEVERQAKLEQQRTNTTCRIHQRAEKPNIAFKCTYCDGGRSEDCIGFKGRCSEEMQRYNIEKEKHIWCRDSQCICMQEHEGNAISENDLICYESRMLIDWVARAGIFRNGNVTGEPMRLANVTKNSLAILTTRMPDKDESERIIFAVFLIRVADEGDKVKEGMVKAHPDYRIELTPEEASKMKFWNYYHNADSSKMWGSKLHRYFDDETAKRILHDIKELKRGKEDEDRVERFIMNFENNLSINV